MDVSIPDKVYFRIGEVARILEVEPHVVRYWESEFEAVKPVRSKSDQRLYRRKDVEVLLVIRDLLYKDHFTISGAKRQLGKAQSKEGSEEEHADKGVDQAGPQDSVRLVQIKRILQEIRRIV